MNPGKRRATLLIALLAGTLGAHADERTIDPTFLHRDASAVKAKQSDLTTASCHYKPLFGQGDADTSVVVGIARYGEAASVARPPGGVSRLAARLRVPPGNPPEPGTPAALPCG